MSGKVREFLIGSVALVAGFFLVYLLSASLTAAKPPLPPSLEDEDLAFSAQKLKGLTLGMDGLIADYYWVRSLQYVGDKILASHENLSLDDLTVLNLRLLYPLLDSATTFDPQFLAAYSYGAVVLPAIDPALAIRIAEKGIQNNPSQWRLHQHLGYIYWKLGRYDEAAEAYGRGSEIQGAPEFMRFMSARLREDGGSASTAMKMYLEICRNTDDRNIREVTRMRMMGLVSADRRPFATWSADGCEVVFDDKSPRRTR